MKCDKPLTIAVDLYGCPNRCRHCWLGHMPNRTMAPGADEWIVSLFEPYFETIEFYSWLREPDFCDDYQARWERDKRLSVNTVPERFELASFWRLARDRDYAGFLKSVGVERVQLTFFGPEAVTDEYIGRKGAFRELLCATDVLLENGICPRWQVFINEENKNGVVELLRLSKRLDLAVRCGAAGGEFKLFVHPGSCDGENRKLYGQRIQKGHIPEELIPYCLNDNKQYAESELCARLNGSDGYFVPHNEDRIVLYVSNDYDLFFNFTHMRPEWRIGNLKTDDIHELVRRAVEEDTPALNAARAVTVGELVETYGDPDSERLFEEEDYLYYLLNVYLERELAGRTRKGTDVEKR